MPPLASETATAPKAKADEVQWTRCPSCEAFVYHKRLKRNLGVCPECNYHFRLPVQERLAQLLDEGSFEDLGAGHLAGRPARLRRLEAVPGSGSRRRSGRPAAPRARSTARRRSAGNPLVVAVMDFAFIGGSMGGGVGEAITRAAELALERREPLLVISASGGARMQEGCVSLMQMAKTSQALARLHEEGLLFISLLTDPTYGGVSASFATLGDLLVAEPGALHRLRRPEGDRADDPARSCPTASRPPSSCSTTAMLDLVEPRETLRASLRKILALHAAAGRRAATALPETEGAAPPIADPEQLPEPRPVGGRPARARTSTRPNTLEYISRHASTTSRSSTATGSSPRTPAIVGGLAQLGERTVMVVGHQKGHTTRR